LSVPIIACVIGEGGSGGAIAIATADHVMMLEHAIYSVISPEGCASILWRSATNSKEATEALKLTAQDLQSLKVIDEIIPEPLGGAHRQPEETIASVGDALTATMQKLIRLDNVPIRQNRRDKFLKIGIDLIE
ncbi:MAG: acetyl-CoA carboxylase carboxyl transferase subunit alpha, partial [Pseudomonadota bacterium]|nr:acetyl-CoA carboxylase carboxyl transferase subunit alpha [Pseudomonadota bacterium]